MQRLLLTAVLAVLVAPTACRRFQTTDEIRASLAGATRDSSWMSFPCQSLVVDEFGMTRHEIDGLSYRVAPILDRYQRLGLLENLHRGRGDLFVLSVQVSRSRLDIRGTGTGVASRKFETCELGGRVAQVVVGRRGFRYESTVNWEDIGDGRSLLVHLRARTVEEAQLLRATLFTFRFP